MDKKYQYSGLTPELNLSLVYEHSELRNAHKNDYKWFLRC